MPEQTIIPCRSGYHIFEQQANGDWISVRTVHDSAAPPAPPAPPAPRAPPQAIALAHRFLPALRDSLDILATVSSYALISVLWAANVVMFISVLSLWIPHTDSDP
ncbi:hypothetical protein A4X09_0g6391 [Tilletia walkeri]|uniref:Uncharacterized protein n=1 Tax=Tilletia walkeri TaxID=117179 RepID=A0A8X7N5I8_9BASI|nr:hypothetical protein A4X09_0g6391 [Tilletia walkeri]